MRLPAPSLACGCRACRERLTEDFIRIIYASFSVADEKNAELVAERVTPPVTSVVNRINAYTYRDSRGRMGTEL